jgi:cellulose synthase/poly-beta-1,6-N-acetylglucosamine synthase-like glycosyltransferase
MQPGVGAVSGSLRLAPGTGSMVALYWSFERWLRRTEARLHSAVGATGAVWALRRSLWQPLRAGLILDDVYGPMRVVLAGQRIGFVENAVAWETRTPTAAQEYRRKVRTLTGVLQLCAWLPAVLLPFRNPIWVQFVFHKLLRMLTPYMLTVMAIWLLVAAAEAARPATLVLGAIAGGVGLTWFLFTGRRWAERMRQLAVEGVLIQFAVLVAGVNGLRGHWQVWDA